MTIDEDTVITTLPMMAHRSVQYGTLPPAPVLSRWMARIYRWNETLWPGADFGCADPIYIRVLAAVGPELAASCSGIPLNSARRDPDGVRCHYIPDAGPVMPTYAETFAGIVESCRADETGLLATLLVTHPEADADLRFLERADALGHAGLCLEHNVRAYRTGRTPWGATVVDLERTEGVAVGFAGSPHVGVCRVLRRLEPDEKLTAEDLWSCPGLVEGERVSRLSQHGHRGG